MGDIKNRQTLKLDLIRKYSGSSQVMVYVILAVILLAAQMLSPGYLNPPTWRGFCGWRPLWELRPSGRI